MNAQLVEYFAQLKIGGIFCESGIAGSASAQLTELNDKFTKLLEDYQTLPSDQQESEDVKKVFYQGQADFHFAANKCILQLCEVVESDDDTDSLPAGQRDPMQIEIDDGTLPPANASTSPPGAQPALSQNEPLVSERPPVVIGERATTKN